LGKPYVTTDITGQLLLLGTGTSVGVPAIGCGCDVCQSEHPRNNRTRSSAIFGLPEGNLLIDTSPDLRHQLIREKIGIVHAVAYTHEHADHIFGLDDLRLFQFYLGKPVPLYCEKSVSDRIQHSFDYAFATHEQTHAGAIPKLEIEAITTQPFAALGATIRPLRLKHGPRFDVLGFRIGDVAYCTDTNYIPEESMALLKGLDVLILDALRPEPHTTHFGLQEAVDAATKIGAKRTIFTHMSHSLDYEEVNKELPSGMELGYDGMKIPMGLAQ
jgi:phosphoribosyl 1,2-cyclic phosphate phosphodiesterase